MENANMSKLRIAISLLLLSLVTISSTAPLTSGNQGAPSQAVRPDRTAVVTLTKKILREVSQLRGLTIRRPVAAALQSRPAIESSLMKDLDEKITAAEFDAATKALIKFGLVAKDFKYRELLIKLLTEQVAGYYRPKTKNLYLADWLSLDEQRTVMVHELVHALQDQHFNLERFEDTPDGQSDKDLAIHALIEGEATAVMLNYLLKPQKLDITALRIPLTTIFDQLQKTDDQRAEVLNSSPAAIRESLLFPYTYGAGFIQHVLQRSSWQQVSSAYSAPPDSTEQILHPEKFLRRDYPVTIELARLEEPLDKTVVRRTFDTNGEFGYLIILAEYLDKETARSAAEGWDGDQFALYENPTTGNLLLAHLSIWDDESEAKEFAEVYAQRTARRYKEAKEIPSDTPGAQMWQTEEGLVYVERRGTDVLVLEGLEETAKKKLPSVANALWQSKKSPVQARTGQSPSQAPRRTAK
jgi:hypothetical protein